jgi:hypothetical protein
LLFITRGRYQRWVFDLGKPVTERVKAHQDRRTEEGRCLKESRDRRPPHGPIFKSRLCEPCYVAFLAYKNKWRRKQRALAKKGRR